MPAGLAGEEEDRAVFTGSYSAPEQPELIWYGFRLRRENGEAVWLGKKGFCAENEITPWQQTVYDDSLPTPDWFGRGVTYQIFPDEKPSARGGRRVTVICVPQGTAP